MSDPVFKVGNVVDENTEGLVCSGNVQLNMSGGVNGELLSRGGANLQAQLHDFLRREQRRFVKPCFAMRIGPGPFKFKTIVYTVAVDHWYNSSIEIVCQSLHNALLLIQEDDCNTVSIPALATGYGKLSKTDFGKALRKCLDSSVWSFSEIRIVLKDKHDLETVKSGFYSN